MSSQGGRVIAPGERFVPDNIYAPTPTAGAPAAATVGSSTTGTAKVPQAQMMSATSSSGINNTQSSSGRNTNTYNPNVRQGYDSGFGNKVANLVIGQIPVVGPILSAAKLASNVFGDGTFNPADKIGETLGWGPIRTTAAQNVAAFEKSGGNANTGYGPGGTGAASSTSGLGYNPGSATTPSGLNTGVGSGFNSANWGGSSTSNTSNTAPTTQSSWSPAQAYSSSSSDSSGDSSSYARGGLVGLKTGLPTQHIPTMPQQHQVAIEQRVAQVIAAGRITPLNLQMTAQLCKVSLQSPKIWPQLRQFAIQQGLVGQNDIPQQYLQQYVLAVIAEAKAAEHLLTGNQVQGAA